MDIAYYLRQFTYDSWANDAAIESIEQLKAKDAEHPRKLMSHIFLSQKVWLMRLIGEEIPSDINIFPLYTIEECHRMTEEFNDFWREYLGNLTKGEIAYPIRYTTTTGVEFVNSVQDIVTHVLTHSAYHRAQIASAVRAAGKTPAVTDFIAYAREFPVKK